MLVRMRTLSAGPDGVLEAGKVYDLPPARAKELLDGGFADVARQDPVETAARSPAAEKAASRTGPAPKPAAEKAKPAAEK